MKVFWWSPTRSLRTLASEALSHANAWARNALANRGRIYNFGDEVTPLILRELTGSPVRWSPPGRADVFAIGSILDIYGRRAGDGARIFGSGVRGGTWEHDPIRPDAACAVRGHLTRSLLGLPEATPLGDPGLAIREFDVRVARGRRPLVIPHMTTLGSGQGRATVASLRAEGFDVVLPNANAMEVARAIASASYLVTASLHGLVFANALGIPAVLSTLDSDRTEPKFKYDDYLSVFGREAEFFDVSDPAVLAMSGPAAERREADASEIAAQVPAIVAGLRDAARTLL